MSYIRVDIDVDIDDIINEMSDYDKHKVLKELSDKDIIKELKGRKIFIGKTIDDSRFTLLDNHKKREYLIKLLDLPHYANDEAIINCVRDNI